MQTKVTPGTQPAGNRTKPKQTKVTSFAYIDIHTTRNIESERTQSLSLHTDDMSTGQRSRGVGAWLGSAWRSLLLVPSWSQHPVEEVNGHNNDDKPNWTHDRERRDREASRVVVTGGGLWLHNHRYHLRFVTTTIISTLCVWFLFLPVVFWTKLAIVIQRSKSYWHKMFWQESLSGWSDVTEDSIFNHTTGWRHRWANSCSSSSNRGLSTLQFSFLPNSALWGCSSVRQRLVLSKS